MGIMTLQFATMASADNSGSLNNPELSIFCTSGSMLTVFLSRYRGFLLLLVDFLILVVRITILALSSSGKFNLSISCTPRLRAAMAALPSLGNP